MTSTGWCPRCGAEYRPGYASCADCHVALVDQQPDPDDPDRRPVTTANLGAEPIYRSLSFTEGVPIVVADDELAVAQEIVAGLDGEE